MGGTAMVRDLPVPRSDTYPRELSAPRKAIWTGFSGFPARLRAVILRPTMSKVTAGVLTGIVLGALHGVWSAWGEPKAMDVFTTILNGVLAAYVTRGNTPLWRGGLVSGLIGLALGALAGLPNHSWAMTLPLGAVVGVGCGLATAAVKSKT
jgi:hypothetical protein